MSLIFVWDHFLSGNKKWIFITVKCQEKNQLHQGSPFNTGTFIWAPGAQIHNPHLVFHPVDILVVWSSLVIFRVQNNMISHGCGFQIPGLGEKNHAAMHYGTVYLVQSGGSWRCGIVWLQRALKSARGRPEKSFRPVFRMAPSQHTVSQNPKVRLPAPASPADGTL